jgi:hypothetical protein
MRVVSFTPQTEGFTMTNYDSRFDLNDADLEIRFEDEDDLQEFAYGDDEDDYDGQPDEYTEWQDYMGGDDWDHGQYDNEW